MTTPTTAQITVGLLIAAGIGLNLWPLDLEPLVAMLLAAALYGQWVRAERKLRPAEGDQ